MEAYFACEDEGSTSMDEPGLPRPHLFDACDLAVTTDFRTLFSDVAERHLGATPAPLFPGWKAA